MWKFAEGTSDRLNSIVDFTNIIETSSTNNNAVLKKSIKGFSREIDIKISTQNLTVSRSLG
jgi:hypothetical protein